MDACDGEFNTAFQGTFTTNIKIKQYSHYLGNRLQALEKFAVLTGNRLDLLPEWKILLKQQFHDTICGTICDAGLADTYAEFRQLEQQLDAKFAQLNSAGPAGVFNPLSFARTEYFAGSGCGYKVTVPPLGIVKLEDCESIDCTATPVQLPCSFANDFYSAEVDASGYISSLIESQSRQQVVNPDPCPFGALALQIDHGDSWLNFDCPLTGGSVEAALNQNDHDPLFRTTKRRWFFGERFLPTLKKL
jgi:alpha-mannosidase